MNLNDWRNTSAKNMLFRLVEESMGDLFTEADWDSLTTPALAAINKLLNDGEDAESIAKIFHDSNGDMDAFVEGLKSLGYVAEEIGGEDGSVEKASVSIKDLTAELKKAQAAIKDIDKNGAPTDISNLNALMDNHPELIFSLGNVEKLRQELQRIADEDLEAIIQGWVDVGKSASGSVQAFLEHDSSWAEALKDVETLADVTELDEEAYPGLLAAIDEWLRSIAKNAVKATEEVEEVEEEAEKTKTIADWAKEIKTATSDLSTLDSAIEKLQGGGVLTMSEMLGLAEAHPELLGVIGDVEQLEAALQELATGKNAEIKDLIKGMYASYDGSSAQFLDWAIENRDVGRHSPLTGWADTYTSLQELRDFAQSEGDVTLLRMIDDYLEEIGADAIAATTHVEELEAAAATSKRMMYMGRTDDVIANGSQADIGTFMNNIYGSNGNVDLTKRPKVKNGDGTTSTVLTHQYTADPTGEWGDVYGSQIALTVTPILPNGEQLSEEALNEYVAYLLGTGNVLEADKIENGGKGLVLDLQDMSGMSLEEATEYLATYADGLHRVQEEYYLGTAALREYAEEQERVMEVARASNNGFAEEVGRMQEAWDSGSIDDVIGVWNSLDERMQTAIKNRFPALVKALGDCADFTKLTDKEFDALGRALNSAAFTGGARTFTNTAKAIEQLSSGSMTAVDALAAFNKEAEAAVKAQAEYATANENMKNGTAVAAEEVKNLATFLGYLNPDVMLDNWDQVGPMLSNALAEGEDAFRRLNEAAFINITGTSEADFSAIQDGLISTQNLAQETIDLLVATGQWTVEDVPLDADVWVKDGDNWIQKHLKGVQQILKPTGNNPFKSKGKTTTGTTSSTGKKTSGGGGGGGRSKKDTDTDNTSSSTENQMTEIERMLDIMEQIQNIQNHTKDMYASMAKYYSTTGELQGVIAYYELEKQALADQNATLEANVKDIEARMKAKQAEVAAMDTSSESYKTAASDLEKLQDTYKSYSKQLIDNKTEMESLTKAIKEQQDAIRKMEIDLRNTIYKAIEDREALIERKLQGRITLENEILDLIQKRYEKERDLILDNAQRQIDALQEERDLLSEQLQLRREQAEEEDKRAKLAELEAQYARISADPTRQKEALNIQKQITDLREEMAWDLAEKEVEAQQNAIDDQITSIEDYMEYVRNYYEDLFEHPKKLIEEMESIITQTDDYIMNWLKENSEAYANATAATQKNMANNWEQMLLDMHGALKLYWDEVEEIISKGDKAIIEFLANNSAEYKKAGKLQAQAYVDQWMEMLQKLALAHKEVSATMISNNMAVIKSATPAATSTTNNTSSTSSSSRSGGSSGPSGSSSSINLLDELTDKRPRLNETIESYKIRSGGGTYSPSKMMMYASGGMADYTGPAWVDGSPEHPEYVLNPQQTDLFMSLVKSLEEMSKVRIPGMPSIRTDWNTNRESMTVGDIIVNVDNLDTEADYEELAEKVFDTIMTRINRGSVVGGIRY